MAQSSQPALLREPAMALPGDSSSLPRKVLREKFWAEVPSPFAEDDGVDPACSTWQNSSQPELQGASMPFQGMSVNTAPAGGGQSMEESAEGQLQWGKKSPRWKRKRSGGSTDPLSELTDDDDDLLVHPRAQHASMGHAADSLAFAEPQIDNYQEQQLQQQQHQQKQQLQEDHGSWAALKPSGGAEERSLSSAGGSGPPRDPRLSSEQQQQQQQENSERSQSYSADLGASAEEEDGEDGAAAEEGWQSTSKTCCLCDNGGQIIYCDGPCYRAFHFGKEPRRVLRGTDEDATEENEDFEEISVYRDYHCNPLRMDQELMQFFSRGDNTFECPNCLAKEHQCYYCKEEGIEQQDVFKCSVGSCGRHYHKHCLAENFEGCKDQAVETGLWQHNSFICPQHTCDVCKQGVEAKDKGQLIPCARCPVAYHLHCLPPDILDSPICRVWLNEQVRNDWGEDHELFQRPSIDLNSGVEDCILYCGWHNMPPGSENPERPTPLISERLLESWQIRMADEHRSLGWSQEFRRKRKEAERQRAEAAQRKAEARQRVQHEQDRQRRLKLKRKLKLKEQQQQEKLALAKRKLEPKRKAEAAGAPKLKRLVKKSALEQAPPAGGISSDELEDLPLAKRVRRDAAGHSRPSSAAAAPVGRQLKQKAKAAGRGVAGSSRPPPASPTFSDLDSSPVPKARKKRVLATEKPPAAALLGTPQRAATAQHLPTGAQEQPAQAVQPGSPARLQQEPVLEAAPQPKEDIAFHELEEQGTPVVVAKPDQAEAGEDMGALIATNFGSDEEGPPDFIGLEALPPPEASPVKEAAVVPEQAPETLQPYEMAEHWAVDKMAARLAAMLETASGRNLIERIEVLMPRPFDLCTTATIPQTRLEEMAKTVKMQQLMDRNRANTSHLLSQHDVKQMDTYQDRMQTFLAPFLHRSRYTSYGRHFTQDKHLRALNEFLLPHIDDGDTVVDFSCGGNVWVPMLKEMCLEAGIEIKGISYDIITPRCMEDFRHGTWYDVEKGELPAGNKLIIGLNPPFGKNGILAAQFAALAAKHRPRLIVLVVPPQTKIPDGYISIKEETSLMAGEAFFVPGSTERSWNATTPSTRILVRQDLYQQVLDMVGMQCIAHHNFEPRMQPGMGMGMGMPMPMQMHMPVGPDYPPAHPVCRESVIAGYPVMPVMGLPY